MSAMLPNWLFKLIQLLIIFGVGSLLIYLGVSGIAVGFLGVVAASLVTFGYVRFMERRHGLDRSELPSFRKDAERRLRQRANGEH